MKKWLLIVAGLLVVGGGVTYWLISKNKAEDVSGGLGITEKDAVCLIEGIALKDAPGPEGEYVGTLNFGEKLTIVEKREVETAKGQKIYYKVELKGGQSGWVKETSIVLAARPAAIAEDAIVYKRPDLITKTTKVFSPLDIVAVVEKQGDFVKVYGKTKDGRKVKGGWIKSDAYTFDDVDVAVAIYVGKANAKSTNEARMAALKEIVDNPDFSNSRFIPELATLTAEPEPVAEPIEEPAAEPDSTQAE